MPQEKVTSALKYADDTKFLEIGSGILKQVSIIFSKQFPDKKAVLVADENTFQIAGSIIQQLLTDSQLVAGAPLILNSADVYANYEYVGQVRDFLKGVDAIPVAVGSGVINDLTKLASYELNRPYMIVGTAASMDGYASFGASITKDGGKQTMMCSAPRAIIADLDLICKAPPLNNASGYADLYAKIPAGADWIFADALGEEAIDQTSWSIVQEGLKDALSNPKGVHKGDAEALRLLTEGLMLGGFAMQSLKSSRPASGAEHQFSHTWDMEHHTFNGEMAKQFGLYQQRDEQAPSHGFKVGVGLLTTTALYEQVLKTSLDQLDVKQAVDHWLPLEQQIAETKQLFSADDQQVRDFAVEQVTKKYITGKDLENQLNTLKDNWPDLKEKLGSQLIPYTESKRKLKEVGAPTEAAQIGISKKRLRNTFYKAQRIRTRFTILDVAVRTGYMDHWITDVFNSYKNI